ncbi:hypothetical protein [Phytoactinopolyspora halotolerans]|uniref:Uncharacterized protein n=1 Tax=Phytoactinopolyspora halotolerans TaxID=1981512 RepID=A0A6L9SC55_9ACTN|nr:hypothetical protein [Phytoactinopolyspora halotolerans]NEE02182.1 hypothetical protein [Phytoactinopolyspora halotolerans]
MSTPAALDDAATEAVLRGEPVSSELVPLAEAVEAIRGSATGYVAPSAELAERIAAGDFHDVEIPAWSEGAGTAARLGSWVQPLRSWTSKLGIRVRVVAGVAALLLGFTGVAAAGGLPESVENGVKGFIERVSPVTFPERADGTDTSDRPGGTGPSGSGDEPARPHGDETGGGDPDRGQSGDAGTRQRTDGDKKETDKPKNKSEKDSTPGGPKPDNNGNGEKPENEGNGVEKRPENPGNGADNRPEEPGEPAQKQENRPENPGSGTENRPDNPGNSAGEGPQDRTAPENGSSGNDAVGGGDAADSSPPRGDPPKERRSDNAPGPPAGKSGP